MTHPVSENDSVHRVNDKWALEAVDANISPQIEKLSPDAVAHGGRVTRAGS